MKKAQAAMEFLMTYGWAILVVLVGISALAYFGVLSPEKSLPESCIFFPGLSCDDFKVDENSVTLVVTNGMGTDLENVQFLISDVGPCQGDSSEITTLKDGEKKTFTILCSINLIAGSEFRRKLQFSYNEVDGLEHNRIGTISTKVES